jgi:hypothetical protein
LFFWTWKKKSSKGGQEALAFLIHNKQHPKKKMNDKLEEHLENVVYFPFFENLFLGSLLPLLC